MNLQLCQLSTKHQSKVNQPPFISQLTAKQKVCFYCKNPAYQKMNCELRRGLEANWILDQNFELNKNRAAPREPGESFLFSLNTLGVVEMIIQGEAMKALIHRGHLFSFEHYRN